MAQMDALALEAAEEVFGHGVVIGIALAGHALPDAEAGETLTVSVGGVLDAAVGVEDEAGQRLAAPDGHAEGGEGEICVDAVGEGVADDLLCAKVFHNSAVEPALAGGDIGNGTICDCFGVTRGSFYHHFNSKEDLLGLWIKEKTDELNQGYTEDPSKSAKDNLRELLLGYASFLDWVGSDLMHSTLSTITNGDRAIWYGILDPMVNNSTARLIEKCQAEGSVCAQHSVEEYLRLYTSAIIGACIRWHLDSEIDIVQEIQMIFDMVFSK